MADNDNEMTACTELANANEAGECAAASCETEASMRLEFLDRHMDLLEESQVSAYLEAKERCPELILSESNPLWYLQLYDDSPSQAAAALALYWTKRKEIFRDRFLKRMDITSDGAMSSEDIAVLRSGVVVVLPNDAEGRPVLYFDQNRNQEIVKAFDIRFVRAFFYLLQVTAMENEAAHTHGVIVNRVIHRTHFRLLVDDLEDLIKVVSLRLHMVNMLCRPPDSSIRAVYTKTIVPAMIKGLGEYQDRAWGYAFDEETNQLPDEFFERCRMTRESLPIEAGGQWKYDSFGEWLDQRRSKEETYDAKPVAENRQQVSDGESVEQPAQTAPGECTDEAMLSKSSATRLDMLGTVALDAFHRDKQIVGGSKSSTEIETDVGTPLQQMRSAIDDTPAADKKAYAEAMKQCPMVVESETSPVNFLRCNRDDPKAAARQLMDHWEKRVELFGRRAFMPLGQTGEGALSRSDNNAANGGAFLILPCADEQGRCVVYFDWSKIGDASRDVMKRVAFYFLCVATESETTQRQGLVLLLPMESKNKATHGKASFASIVSVMPAPVAVIHAFCAFTSENKEAVIRKRLTNLSESSFGRPENQLYIHLVPSMSMVADKLANYGLRKQNLPKVIGGQWGIERFVEWMELRVRYEWDLPAPVSYKSEDKIFDFSNVKNPATLTEEERVERSRRLNVLHSRRKRERERIEVEVLKEQCDELRRRNEFVSNDNTRLEFMLSSAMREVSVLEGSGLSSLAGASQSAVPLDFESQDTARVLAANPQLLLPAFQRLLPSLGQTLPGLRSTPLIGVAGASLPSPWGLAGRDPYGTAVRSDNLRQNLLLQQLQIQDLERRSLVQELHRRDLQLRQQHEQLARMRDPRSGPNRKRDREDGI